MKVTARAHTNIALVKYWGKKDQQLIIPQTDSLSLTLDKFYTDTTVEFQPELKHDQLVVDGQVFAPEQMKKVTRVLDRVRELSNQTLYASVNSTNHVPMAAGLASSASAFAALALSASRSAGLTLSGRDLSRLARRGSGSATRSVFGGLVEWHAGHDDQSSYAEPIMENVGFDIEMLAILIDTKQKKISSTYGMKDAQSSPFFRPWLERNDSELNEMIKAIKSNDFTALGQLAELNANEMHAINLTAQPEFTYFEPQTIQAIKLVEQLRTEGIECYYTIDAGPNIKVLCQLRNSKDIIQRFSSEFNNVNIVNASFGPGITYLD